MYGCFKFCEKVEKMCTFSWWCCQVKGALLGCKPKLQCCSSVSLTQRTDQPSVSLPLLPSLATTLLPQKLFRQSF